MRMNIENITFVAEGPKGRIETKDINAVIFSETEGIYYINNEPVKSVECIYYPKGVDGDYNTKPKH